MPKDEIAADAIHRDDQSRQSKVIDTLGVRYDYQATLLETDATVATLLT